MKDVNNIKSRKKVVLPLSVSNQFSERACSFGYKTQQRTSIYTVLLRLLSLKKRDAREILEVR